MKKTVLIVEDNEINREMLRIILSDRYEVLEAGNGKIALEILEEKKEEVMLILLDVMMPVMDGYAFLGELKKDPELSTVPVIVMTQRDSESDELAALAHGATDFIPKPYRPQIIRHRVEGLIKFRETVAMVNQFKYDALTGLYTKEYFYQRVRKCLDENPDKEYTIICCNLENFKLYNDTFGRKAGDQLLIKEAKILPKKVGKDAIICRYNADRFLCLTDRESERLGRKKFVEEKKKGSLTYLENMVVKLGIYEINKRSIPVEQMCDRAFWVVDTIKGIYNQYVAVYDDTLRSQVLREQAIAAVMEKALKENQFIVYFQPKYNLQDDCILGAEALVRWIHPEWGFMSPGEFIPLFEKNGFIQKLDEFVWERACKIIKEWKDKGYPLVPVSVNVSRADFYHTHLVEHFCELIEKYEIEPKYLHLEVTESAYTDSPEKIVNTVSELREKGFIIEMDDFGSGYSSLNMLSQMSIDILKLDMEFIRNELAKAIEKSILVDVIHMAHRMQLKVVAEGVETVEQKNRLQSMGCDLAQGYYYARPMPCNEFEILL